MNKTYISDRDWSFVRVFALLWFWMAASSPALAVDNLFPIKMGEGMQQGHSYDVSVLSIVGIRPMAGPYEFVVGGDDFRFGIRGRSEQRRDIMVCARAKKGSNTLGGGKLVYQDGNYLPLLPRSTGQVCTPKLISVDRADVAHLELKGIPGQLSEVENPGLQKCKEWAGPEALVDYEKPDGKQARLIMRLCKVGDQGKFIRPWFQRSDKNWQGVAYARDLGFDQTNKAEFIQLAMLPKVSFEDSVYTLVSIDGVITKLELIPRERDPEHKMPGFVREPVNKYFGFYNPDLERLAGDRRASVRCVQGYLNALGYSAGPIDGAMGGKTASASQQALKKHLKRATLPELTNETAFEWCMTIARQLRR